MVSITPLLNYGKRIINVTPDLVFGMTGGGKATSEVLGNAMLNGYRQGGLFNAARSGWQTLEGASASSNLGFWGKVRTGIVDGGKATWEGISNFGHNFNVGSRAANIAALRAGGKNAGASIWAGLKGGLGAGLKGFSKAIPYVGTALLVLFEIPNIYNAVKEKGLWQGLKETGKAGGRLLGAAGGAAAGAALGSAICPGIGTTIGSIVGWVAGEWLAGKIVGKSYSEEKQEQQEQLAQVQQQLVEQQSQAVQAYQTAATENPYAAANPYAMASNPFVQSALNQKFANDFMFRSTFG